MDIPKEEILKVAKNVVETFTIQYTKAYTIALVQQIKAEVNAEPEPDWQLDSRPEWKRDLMSGYLTKEGAIMKSWKKRYFVVRPDYSIDYFSDEAASKKEKPSPKGQMALCGYTVNTDPNDTTINRLKRLAEKMGMDLSALPKPKEYPPFTIEIYHWRRRAYYITAANQEEFDGWVQQFRACCWNARGLTFDDECHKAAFPVAVRKTRWELGRWGWWSWGGNEEQTLSEMIADELEYEIMGRVFGKLPGPWFIRDKIRSKVQKIIDGLVMGVVKPAWKAMRKAVEELRPKIEPKIRELTQPIFEAEKKIVDTLKDKVMSVITPLQEEHVNPHLKKAIDILRKPMTDAYAEAFKLFDQHIDKWEPKENLEKSFWDLDWFPRSYWEMRPSYQIVDTMYQDLSDLRIIFKDIYPWSLLYHANKSLSHHTDCAVYTWEQQILGRGADGMPDKETIHKLKHETMEKFKHDADIAIVHFCAKVMKLILLPPFEAVLQPAAKMIIEPLADAVPDPLKDFIDINQDFEDLYNGVLDDAIDSAIQHAKAAAS